LLFIFIWIGFVFAPRRGALGGRGARGTRMRRSGLRFFFAGSRYRGGLLALPLPGAGVTFFAAAKKVTKESSFSPPAVTRTLAMLASRRRHSPKCRPQRPIRAWLAHGLTNHNLERTGSAPKSSSPLRGRWVNRVCVCFFFDGF